MNLFNFTANNYKFFNWQHYGTEELAHLEMVGTIVHQLTKNASIEEIEKAGLGAYYTDHGVDVYPQSAAGVPFSASVLACKGDPIANLQEDLAAEGAYKKEQLSNYKINVNFLHI